MAMIRFAAFTSDDFELVKAFEVAQKENPDTIPDALAENYRELVKDNFGKLMSTMIGEIARFFDIAIKRKYDWDGYYGWIFSYHNDMVCWYGISYRSESFINTAFAVKCNDAHQEQIDMLVADEGYKQMPFAHDQSDWVVKIFENNLDGLTTDEEQMDAFSKVAEDQLDLLEA